MSLKRSAAFFAAILVAAVGGFFLLAANTDQSYSPLSETVDSKAENQERLLLQDDFLGAKIDKADLIQGCSGQDCIPSIDNPVFEDIQIADEWLEADDTIFTIEYNGEFRAYPQRIMNWHEIVNDEIAGDPIAVTFCPLCGSAVVFHRFVDGQVAEFGVSGMLHNSDLVMYDRIEGNLWQQITGEAIVGPAARRDEILEQVNIFTTTWEEWSIQHPSGKVLSRETGYVRDYNRYPYGTYEEDDVLLFGIEGLDTSLQIKTVVYGVEVEGGSKAYTEDDLKSLKRIEDSIAGTPVLLLYEDGGSVRVTNQQTGADLTAIRLFWFAWAAFHPDTDLFDLES